MDYMHTLYVQTILHIANVGFECEPFEQKKIDRA